MRIHGLALAALLVLATVTANAQDTDPAALFDKLKVIDDMYCSSLTLSGTRVNAFVPDGTVPPTEQNWRFSVDGDQMAIYDVVTGVLRWEDVTKPGEPIPPPGQVQRRLNTQTAVYIDSAQRTALYFNTPQMPQAGPVRPGTLRDVAPATEGVEYIEPTDLSGTKREVIEVLWSAGRGFTREMREITSVSVRPDGMLEVKGTGASGLLGTETLELLVDPRAAYMVRSAKVYMPGIEGRPWVEVSNEGTNWNGDCCYPSEASMTEINGTDTPTRSTRKFDAGGFGSDPEFMAALKAALAGPFTVPVSVIDRRSNPPVLTSLPGLLAGIASATVARDVMRAAAEETMPDAQGPVSPASAEPTSPASPLPSAPAAGPTTSIWWIAVPVLAAALLIVYAVVRVRAGRRGPA